ncbi:sulfurtransferase complex subunit TusC [Billgrantia gudaonensis]|uniref:tRNA 2-thiouridine synthesizing protein C n=1 Tax=Billgrantia gudaonensis TaxID=376427 RepID=A0A1G8WLJ5_9GAMM|nr:sulfurtransferase complex subunit TusC [Halomonas gudaonensis]SDJ79258.1 tRNA 2-thiouridine synthesizing protein C [Halomonas gudaonensis]
MDRHAAPRGDLLVILRHPPHGTSWLRDGLDAALVAAAFGQTVSLLFQGDGLLALLDGQGRGALGQKGTAATLEMLSLYDIDALFADTEALARLELRADELMLPVVPVDTTRIAAMLASHRQVLVF